MDPTIIVDSKGQFLAIKDIDRILNSMKKVLSELTSDAPLPANVQQFLQQFLEAITSAQALTAAVESHWSSLVGFWAGQRLEPGELYESKGKAPLPLPGAPTVEMVSHIEVEGPFPCDGGKGRPLCARIRTSARFDEVQIRKAIEGFMREATEVAGASLQIRYKDMDVSTTLVLVTEISTLRPYDYRTEKTVRITIVGPDGKEQKASQIERRHSVYTY
jgi:hypothetical protein